MNRQEEQSEITEIIISQEEAAYFDELPDGHDHTEHDQENLLEQLNSLEDQKEDESN
jgi:hypothetical protein